MVRCQETIPCVRFGTVLIQGFVLIRRPTVPVLWDKRNGTIVNNESSEIIRMFNSAFNALLPPEKAKLDFYPSRLRKEIDEINEWVYDTVNSASSTT